MAIDTTENLALPDGGSMRALLALPEKPTPAGGWPAVIAIHDIFGFSPDIRRIARRFADSGYAALAPALFDGAGAPPLCVARTLRDVSRGEGPAFERLDRTRAFLAARPEIAADRIGVTGFCMGGAFALTWAARGGLQVCAPYYGQVPRRAESLRKICPVVAGFGELDAPLRSHARRLEQHLSELKVPHDVKVYPGVGHSYMNDLGDGAVAAIMRRLPMHAAYDESASEDSWRRMLGFFAKYL